MIIFVVKNPCDTEYPKAYMNLEDALKDANEYTPTFSHIVAYKCEEICGITDELVKHAKDVKL